MKNRIHVTKGSFSFANGPLTEDIRGEYYYSDEYFNRNAAILNPHLRTVSFVLCMTCFPSVRAKKEGGYIRVYRHAETFLTENGFSDFRVNPDYEKEPAADTLGMLAAHKVIEEAGEKVSLVAVGLRGADYGDEWAANLIMGEEGPAAGFNDGMHYADAFLKQYLEGLGDKLRPRVKYWITGYSRVAGITNLLGAWIDRHAAEYHTETGDLFVYTFEGPAAAPKEDRRPYPSIHNTISLHDLVPRMAPEAWGFRRYGTDDTVFPAIHSRGFENKIGEVQERLYAMNPEMYYEPRAFRTTSLKGLRTVRMDEYEAEKLSWRADEWWYHAKQDEFLDRFMDFMCKKIQHPEDGTDPNDETRRRRFVKTYQAPFSQLARSFMGEDERTKGELRKTLVRMVREDITPQRKAYLAFKLFQNREHSFRQVERFLERILSNRILSNEELNISRNVLEDFLGAIEQLVYYIVKCFSYDMRRHRIAYFLTLFNNLDQIKTAHMPEVIFAWLMTLDSYYHKDMSEYMEADDKDAEDLYE